MKKTNKFSPEVRERAVRMVQEHRGEYPSLWAAIESGLVLNPDQNLGVPIIYKSSVMCSVRGPVYA